MDLHALAWMVRDLGQPVSCLRLLEDHVVVAGGWDGEVRCWDGEGGLLWRAATPDRVSAITPPKSHSAVQKSSADSIDQR